ncbi:hypothetical protein NIES2101_42995 [Calothrix sp. HK-06]|nr:hypothetical protein NIES2101_42995 [Calothrix sp. HK-06]
MLKKFVFTATALLVMSLPAVAKDFNFVKIAEDADGNPVMIDTKSFKGNKFSLYQSKGGQLIQMQFDASCPEARVWLRRITLYSSSGRKIAEDKQLTPMSPQRDTPSGAGLVYFCRSFRVPGY